MAMPCGWNRVLVFQFLAILAIPAILAISSYSGDFGNPKDSVYLLINFFAYPTSLSRLLLQTRAKVTFERPVEAPFSLRSALESRSIFLAVRIEKFTL